VIGNCASPLILVEVALRTTKSAPLSAVVTGHEQKAFLVNRFWVLIVPLAGLLTYALPPTASSTQN